MNKEISKLYNPKEVEEKWYKFWEEKNFFRADINYNKKPFTIVIPPPNVTGSLHIGHALNNTLQDILIRYKRMKGFVSLWLPGTDHAGIATQNVVEKEIAKEGLTRYKLGREKFLERVWEWKEKYGNTIINQLKKLGCSCDWSRLRFTMDEDYSNAIKEVFVRLYQKRLIYRDKYIINWCPRCQTALSDIEVEHKQTKGHLYYIKYFYEKSEDFIVVATTRPETMLGDTAVAVNPHDERYKEKVGKILILPILERKIPLIADFYADPKFGTGAVKVTPGHDFTDFEAGRRNNLEIIIVISEDGKMTEQAGPYAGLDRFECRKKILKDLKDKNFLQKIEDYELSLSFCSRCDNVIEPLVSLQWFVRMKELAKEGIKVVNEKKIKFIPERYKKVYLDWMENIKDWCISRQIWWGHQIPAYYCNECNNVNVDKEKIYKCKNCGSENLKQEEDVLDTWFSSGLWPFATLGWPKKTEDLEYFYPTDVLVTDRGIIHLWVARMIMLGLEFCKDIPYHTVYINPTVFNIEGKRMSKSLGTGVDPLELMEKFGSDATRFGLILQCAKDQDLRFSEENLLSARNFCNKIWNATRFILMNLEDKEKFETKEISLADKWILSRYNNVVKVVNNFFENYEFNEIAKTLYHFIWNEFCDWYVEIAKLELARENQKETAEFFLTYILSNTMKLLHPFMPFITEEIYQSLPHDKESIMVSSFPEENIKDICKEAEEKMEKLFSIIRAIRNLRADLGISPKDEINIYLQIKSNEDYNLIKEQEEIILSLAKVKSLNIDYLKKEKPKNALSSLVDDVEIYLPIQGIDLSKEKERLKNEIKKIEEEMQKIDKKLSKQDFLKKAPKEIIEKEENKKKEFLEKKEKIEERLRILEKL